MDETTSHLLDLSTKPPLSIAAVLARTFALAVVIFIGLIALTLVGVGLWLNHQLSQLAQAANSTPNQLIELVKQGWQEPVTQTNGKKNLLILGVDQVANRTGDPLLTDTIMLASINTTTAQVNLVSLPRDLWLPDYQTKINALYFYGQERYPSRPEQFTEEVITEFTQVPLHHTIVLNLNQVAQLIDLLGGIDVEVTIGFSDPEFPRDDVDIRTVTDPQLLYETVTFEAGPQTMTGKRALQFIRSRHSGDDQGTDQARGLRQQQVIEALLQKLLSPATLSQPTLVGSTLNFYQHNFAASLPATQLIAVGKQLLPNRNGLEVSIYKDNLSIQTATESGVITHPPLSQTQNQWSYTIVDDQAFKDELWQKLALPQ